MTAPALIRELSASEFQRVWPIFQDVIACGDSYSYPANLTLEQARAMWTTAPAQCFVAESAATVLGCYRLAPNHERAGRPRRQRKLYGGVGRARPRHRQAAVRALTGAGAPCRLHGDAVQHGRQQQSGGGAVMAAHGFRHCRPRAGAFRHATLGPTDTYVMHRML